MANLLKAGYAQVDITPPMGIDVAGYYKVRKAEGVLDNISAVALALSVNDKKALIITEDETVLISAFCFLIFLLCVIKT